MENFAQGRYCNKTGWPENYSTSQAVWISQSWLSLACQAQEPPRANKNFQDVFRGCRLSLFVTMGSETLLTRASVEETLLKRDSVDAGSVEARLGVCLPPLRPAAPSACRLCGRRRQARLCWCLHLSEHILGVRLPSLRPVTPERDARKREAHVGCRLREMRARESGVLAVRRVGAAVVGVMVVQR